VLGIDQSGVAVDVIQRRFNTLSDILFSKTEYSILTSPKI